MRPRRPTRPGFESRSSDSHVYPVNKRPTLSDAAAGPDTLFPDTAIQQRLSTKTRASVDSEASKASSNTSSIARRALRALKGPAPVKPPAPTTRGKGTRPGRGAYAWKRQISGHSLEIRIVRKPDTDKRSPDKDQIEPSHGSYPTRSPDLNTTLGQVRTPTVSKAQGPLNTPPHKSTDSSSVEEKPRRSLVNRTRRILGLRSTVTTPLSAPERASRQAGTGDILDRASSALRDLVDKHKMTPPSSSTSTGNASATSIADKPKHRGRMPGRGRGGQHTGHSSSSSVLRMMLGKPPVSTPNSDCMYTGSDAQQYFRVELTEAGAPTYLPSEARRIGTPPLPGSGTKLRGFFFDLNAPRSASEQREGSWPNAPMNTAPLPHRQAGLTTPSHRVTTPRSPGARVQRNDKDVDWFRIKVAVDEATEERDNFELNVPEHLPSSPLCPRHPKHKSGGKGVCVYHGRNKVGKDEAGDVGAGWR